MNTQKAAAQLAHELAHAAMVSLADHWKNDADFAPGVLQKPDEATPPRTARIQAVLGAVLQRGITPSLDLQKGISEIEQAFEDVIYHWYRRIRRREMRIRIGITIAGVTFGALLQALARMFIG